MKRKTLLMILLIALVAPWANNLFGQVTVPEGEPWTENFENFPLGTQINTISGTPITDAKAYSMNVGDWHIYFDDGTSAVFTPALYTDFHMNALGGTSSNNLVSVQFYNNRVSTLDPTILVLPEFSNSLGSLQFEFLGCVSGNNKSGALQVGYYNSDGFTPVSDDIIITVQRSASPNNAKLGPFNFPNDASGKIALRYVPKNTDGCINLDEFVVKNLNCSAPTDLVNIDVTGTTASFSWTASGNSQYVCVPQGETPDWSNAVTTSNTSVTLEGLASGTDYDFYVRKACDVDIFSEGIMLSFTTDAVVVTYEITVTANEPTWGSVTGGGTYYDHETATLTATPASGKYGFVNWTKNGEEVSTNATFSFQVTEDATYVANFENLCPNAITDFPWCEGFDSFDASSSNNGVTLNDPCWINEHISGSTSNIFKVYLGNYNGNNSGRHLRLPKNGTSSALTYTKLVLPEMYLDDNTHSFSLDMYRGSNSSTYDTEGIRVYASADGNIEGATEIAFISRRWSIGVGNLYPAETQAGWYTYTFSIPMTGTCCIILRGEQKNGDILYLDNLCVNVIHCDAPAELVTTNLTGTTASFSWTDSGDFEYVCVPQGDTPDWSNAVTTSNTSVTLEGLNPGTDYDFCVRKVCVANLLYSNPVVLGFTTDAVAVTYEITVMANEPTWGTVTGGGTYYDNETATLEATPISGQYGFVNWTKNGEVVSTEATFTFTVTEDATYVANFVNLCEAITITEDTPWMEDFENFYHVTHVVIRPNDDNKAYRMDDRCWNTVNLEEGGFNPVLYTNYSTAAFSGTTSVQLYNRGGACILILPEFTNPLNTLQFEFKANYLNINTQGTLEIGYYNGDEFHAVCTSDRITIPRDAASSSSPYMGPYPLVGDIPSGSRMALRYTPLDGAQVGSTSGNSAGALNFDDFRVSITPTCDDPTNLVNTSVTGTTASFSWTGTGDFQYVCIPQGDTPDWNNAVTISNASVSLEGLNPGTDYDFCVRKVCVANLLYSNPVVLGFTTDAVAITYEITVVANEPTWGTVTGGGTYYDNETATLTATPNLGYIFSGWDDGNTDSPRIITVTGDATYVAIFSDPCPAIYIEENTSWTENFDEFDLSSMASYVYNNSTVNKAYRMDANCYDVYPPYTTGAAGNNRLALYYPYKQPATSGDGSVQFWNANNSDGSILILPKFSNDLNDLTFEFKANVYQPQNEGAFEVGYWDTTFHALYTGIQTTQGRSGNDNVNASGDYFGPYIFSGNIPEGSRIALRYSATTSSGCVNVDDLRVTHVSCVPPTNLHVTDVGPYSAVLNWDGNADNYNVRYIAPLFFESFENGLGGWTLSQGDPSSMGWYVDDPSQSASLSAHSGTNVVWSFSDVGFHADDWLVSPLIDLGGTLKYWAMSEYQDAYEVVLFGPTIDTVTLRPLSASTITWTEVGIDLSAYEGQQGHIAFHHDYTDGFFLMIDDIGLYGWCDPIPVEGHSYLLEGLEAEAECDWEVQADCGEEDGQSIWVPGNFSTIISCYPPTGLTVNDITAHSAVVSWDAEEDVTFQYSFPRTYHPNIDPATLTYTDIQGNSKTLINLREDEDYAFFLRKNCHEDGYSEIITILFHTLEACPAPTNLSVTGITRNDATISWEGVEPTFEYVYVETGFAPDWSVANTTSNSSVTLTDLSSATDYTFYVRGACDAADISRIDSISFVTDCDPITILEGTPWEENFDGYGLAHNGGDQYQYSTANGSNKDAYRVTEVLDCWKVDPAYTRNGKTQVCVYTAYAPAAYSGEVSVQFWNRDNADGTVLILPEFSNPLSQLEFKFKGSYYSQSGNLVVGYWNNDQFYPVEEAEVTIDRNGINSHLDEYVGTFTFPSNAEGRIALRHYYPDATTNTGGCINLDDFVVSVKPSYTLRFTTAGNWNEATNWTPNIVPNIFDDAIVEAAAIIPNGIVAEANNITFETGGSITIADGGQLKTNADVAATMKKNILGYGINYVETDNGYYLMALPTTAPISAANAGLMTNESEYDLYSWDRTATDEEWQNNHDGIELQNGMGYLYANRNDMEMSFTATLRNSGEAVVVTASFDEVEHGGWNLFGNPFPCEAYITTDAEGMTFYRLIGNELVPITGAIAPMEGFFVKATAAGQTFTISREAPEGR